MTPTSWLVIESALLLVILALVLTFREAVADILAHRRGRADALVEQLTGTIAELVAARIEQQEQIERLRKALASQVDQKKELLAELAEANKARDLAREASSRDLERSREVMYLQHRFGKWVRERIGPEAMAPAERAMRLLEEAVELAQAHGITKEMAVHQVDHVYDRPAGEPRQEAGGGNRG